KGGGERGEGDGDGEGGGGAGLADPAGHERAAGESDEQRGREGQRKQQLPAVDLARRGQGRVRHDGTDEEGAREGGPDRGAGMTLIEERQGWPVDGGGRPEDTRRRARSGRG